MYYVHTCVCIYIGINKQSIINKLINMDKIKRKAEMETKTNSAAGKQGTTKKSYNKGEFSTTLTSAAYENV